VTSWGVIGELVVVGGVVVVGGFAGVAVGVVDFDTDGVVLDACEAVVDVADELGKVPPLAIEANTATMTTAMTAALTGCFLAAATTPLSIPAFVGVVATAGGACVVHCVPSHHLDCEGSFGSGYQPGGGAGGCVMLQS